MPISLPLTTTASRQGALDFIELKRQQLKRHLATHLEGEVRFDLTSRTLYSTDASIYRMQPLGVVIPRTAADLRTTVQVCAEMRIPITARGGGTSLSGQSIGPGIIIDCSKYLNQVLDIDPVGRRVRVQPGVVLDQLNRTLLPHGVQFGPEVATASRATLGGMLGNNSAGSRSIIFGKTAEHTHQLRALLADGTPVEFGPLQPAEWEQKTALPTHEGAIYREVTRIIRTHASDILARSPRIPRSVSGYNLAGLLGGGSPPSPLAISKSHDRGLLPLVVGSEGTLAVLTEAELNVVPRPRARALAVIHFASLTAAMDALAACVEFGPSAVELLDQMLLDVTRNNLALRDAVAMIGGRPAAVYMVEFFGDTPAEVADKVEKLQRRLREVPGVLAVQPALDPARRDALWTFRSAAAGLLQGLYGDRKATTFVEDAAVAPARLPEFVGRFQAILDRHGTSGAYYGHASVGCLHIRPVLNLKDAADVTRMRLIAEEVCDLVVEFGGALSGEHGDGLVRSEFNRRLFGPVVYEAFREVKRAFDPNGVLNPGRVVDAPPMTENLRYGTSYHAVEPATLFDYSRQEGFVRSIELCNGNGACRKQQGGVMCPSYRATRDEKDTTRARANALRLALSGDQPLVELRSRWVYDVLDLCLMCKACKSECPSNVDLAKLKAEFLSFYYSGRLRPVSHTLMAHIGLFNRLAAPIAPLVNWLQQRTSFRWLLEQAAGIDQRRSLPSLQRDHFRRWFASRSQKAKPKGEPRLKRRVLLLDDCFTTFNEPGIGKAAVRLLEAAGYSVELAGISCCCRPMLSKGMLHQARAVIQAEIPRLARRLADGVPILGLEPSCILSLADEWPELVPSPDVRRIAAAAELADGWLAREVKAGHCTLPLAPRSGRCVVHGHCHQKALMRESGTIAALRLIPELEVTTLDAGCCGMAGSFGFEKEHYDISVQIANLGLLPKLAETPAATVAAPGTSCRHQIHDLAGLRALHPLEVLAAQLPAV